MWSQKQLLFAVTRRSLLVHQARTNTFCISRNPVASGRHFSSVVQEYHHDDDDDDEHSTESYSKNREALQKLLTASSAVATQQRRTEELQQLNDTPTNDVGIQVEKDLSKSPSELMYTGGATIPVTSIPHIVPPQEDTPRGVWPIFRMMVSQAT